MTFVYILNTSEIKVDEVKRVLEAVPPKLKENIMTTYSLIKQEGKTEVVLALNEDSIPIRSIAKYTKLTEEQVIEILKKHGRM